ncbi:hypothetical protein [Actinophytocola sp.]|uniref:hypothetical protein n=1 Tax=Actinophytocola sp. TaxID=1872138 RepID=UPI002D7F241C|nr:hypothetical protein [Actinophytocola sp.]HET9142790.1 hypothetical protein [Actinophytocola sp.]
MTVHAFADESRHGSTYLVAVALAHPANLRCLRRDLRALLLPGQREVHFKREKEPRQRELVDSIRRMAVEVRIYRRSCQRRDEPARQDCIARLTRDLLDGGAHRLVLDSRSNRDIGDEVTIRRVISGQAHPTQLVYEHLGSTTEPLLWVADTAAWCFNAGGHWRKRISTVVSAVIDLDCPE